MKNSIILTILLTCLSLSAHAQSDSSAHYKALASKWYNDGVTNPSHDDAGKIVFGMLAPNVKWFSFGPAGFKMNHQFNGATSAPGPQCITGQVCQFFMLLEKELGVDDTKDFHVYKMEASGNIVTIWGEEKGMVTPYIHQLSPTLKTGSVFYNYFVHQLTFNANDQISEFRVNWNLNGGRVDLDALFGSSK